MEHNVAKKENKRISDLTLLIGMTVIAFPAPMFFFIPCKVETVIQTPYEGQKHNCQIFLTKKYSHISVFI